MPPRSQTRDLGHPRGLLLRIAGSGENDLSLLDGVGDFGKILDIDRRISLEYHQVGLHSNGDPALLRLLEEVAGIGG